MSAFSNWPLSDRSSRLDLRNLFGSHHSAHPLLTSVVPTALGFYHRAAGHFMRRSEHDEHLVGYVVSGHGYLQIGEGVGRIYKISPGSLWWVSANVSHYYYASPSTPWSVYWAHVQVSTDADLIHDLIGFSKGPLVKLGIQQRLIQSYEHIISDVQNNPKTLAQLVSTSAGLRAWLCEVAVLIGDLRDLPDPLVDHANRVFSEHLGEKFSLDRIAAEFSLSKYHFSRKYKTLTGRTPASAFMEFKINHSCELLKQEKYSIGQISDQLNFCDDTHFTKVFARQIGVSPSKYRAGLSKG